MKKKLILTLATLSIAILCFGFFQGNNVNNSVEAEETAVNAESTTTMTQDDVKNLMINSIDNFDSAEGEFTYYSESSGFDYSVSYEVSNLEGYYGSHVVTKNNVTGDVEEWYFDGVNFTILEHGEKTYKTSMVTLEPLDIGKELYTFENRTPETLNGEQVTYYRYDPTVMGMAGNSLFPQGFAFGYLDDNSLWSVTGYEEYLGREVVVLEGYPGDYQAEKIKSDSFKMWVDTETGILLKYEAYNNGKMTEQLETTKIMLNDPSINELSFSCIIPEDYTELVEEY